MRARRVLPIALLVVACGGNAPGPASPEPPGAPERDPWVGQADRGVTDPRLAEIVRAHWEWSMSESPTWATRLGDHRFDDRIRDRSPEAAARRRAERRRFRDALTALDDLGPEDAVTRTLLADALEADIGAEVCRFDEWNVSARSNAVVRWNRLPELHPVETPRDGATLLARYAAIAGDVDQEIANLRRGLTAGWTASAETVRRTHALVAAELGKPTEAWTLLDPVEAPHDDWPRGTLEGLRGSLRQEVGTTIRPAFARYAAFLEEELLPAARPPSEGGLSALPEGAACYRAMIRVHLGIERTPETLHALGEAEIAGTDAAMASLGRSLFGAADLAETLTRLRADASLHFDTREAVEAQAAEALDRARGAVPAFFGRLPRAPCAVRRVPDYEAPFTTIAYYRPPSPDGSRPGEYFVNSFEPGSRPRYGMEALTFHESIPGHHLQIALAQELEDLPLFRRHTGATTLVEGWALYSERLADEMGLYTGDLDRLGMHSYQAWRGARLVVDTGLHALGWSREEAVRYMLAHTALAEVNVRNEVDRYLAMPGQALAYMVGQLEILRLRAQAEEALGDRFALPAFHDVVLGAGAVSLPVLAARVESWVAERSAEP